MYFFVGLRCILLEEIYSYYGNFGEKVSDVWGIRGFSEELIIIV